MQYAIETHALTKRYGQRVALDGLTLQVAAGQVFGLLGPNGAGKTTTIGMLLGLIRPTSGTARVLGHAVPDALSQVLPRVGAMVEAPAFYPYLSGADNLRALAIAAGLPKERIATVLAQVDLSARATDRFRTYSQGMKQRLAIGAALLGEPDLVILDEPTNGLDPAGQQEIQHLIRHLASAGRTVVLCSHQLAEVETLCAAVAILRQGKLVAHGAVSELLGSGGVLVRVAGDAAAAVHVLRELPNIGDVRVQADGVLVHVPAERAPELNAALVAGGVAVLEIRPQRQRLEELFLDVTK